MDSRREIDRRFALDEHVQHLERLKRYLNSMRLDRGQIEVLDDSMAEVLRHKTPAERIAIGFSLWESARTFLTAHLGRTHPAWDEKRVEEEVAKRLSHGAA